MKEIRPIGVLIILFIFGNLSKAQCPAPSFQCGNEVFTCTASDFACADNSTCISNRWVCDGEADCNDNSDEENCEIPTCAANYFQCTSSFACIPETWTCDGDSDCVNGSDEADCGTGIVSSRCGEGLFTCTNGDCIHGEWKCDGENDCGDSSDEDISICPAMPLCPPYSITCQDDSCAYGILCNGIFDCEDGSDEHQLCTTLANQTCSLNQFMCRDGTCIDQNRYCDGLADCVQGEDEPVNQNCGVCPTGFMFNGETGSCDDIDECNETWGACSQVCLNHNGTYTCKCKDGFQLINNTFCNAIGPSAAVVFVFDDTIRKFNVSSHEYEYLFTGLTDPLALALDVNEGIIFWSDTRERKIMMGYLNGRHDIRVAVEGIGVVEDIGYDWIHNNLFWTDTLNDTINVASREGDNRKILFTEHLAEPRAIAVDPRTGYMFWSDWGVNPRIERARMHGADRQTIIDNNKVDIYWPNGLTIDYPSDMLYWVDAHHHMLATCDFNGDNYRVILRDRSTLMHPFHVAVFEDNVYWTDWDAASVRRVNRFTGTDLADVVGNLVRRLALGVQIWHPSQQLAETNYCDTENARCTHLCVPSPEGQRQLSNYTCMCPDGMDMSSDGFSCTGLTNPLQPLETTESIVTTDEISRSQTNENNSDDSLSVPSSACKHFICNMNHYCGMNYIVLSITFTFSFVGRH